MLNAVRQTKERSMMGKSALPPPAPMMPSMLNTFKNRAFVLLLPAWVLDSFFNTIFLSLMPYYIRSVDVVGYCCLLSAQHRLHPISSLLWRAFAPSAGSGLAHVSAQM
jgi:Na+/melibiose symporter-like transporter